MEQTAVEWLEEQWLKLDLEFTGLIDTKQYDKRRNFIIEQAKAMEKEYLERFYNQGYTQCSIEDLEPKSRERFVDAEDYYNKTFKSE